MSAPNTAPELAPKLAAIIPLVMMVLVTLLLFFQHSCIKGIWQDLLRASKPLRILLFLLTMAVIPLWVGAWSDLLDWDHLIKIEFTQGEIVRLTLLASALPVYIYFVIIWALWEEQVKQDVALAEEREREANLQLVEAKCQRDYLTNLLEHFRNCICGYSQLIVSGLQEHEEDLIDAEDWLKPDETVGTLLVDSARFAFSRLPELPPHAHMVTALFVQDDSGYLVPIYSHDGAKKMVIEKQFESFKHAFRLDQPNASVAVEAANQDRIFIVEDTAEAHNDVNHAFKYLGNEAVQRDHIKSLICIPLRYDGAAGKTVLSLHCDQTGAFRESFRWKANQLRKHLEARLELLHNQRLLLAGLRLSANHTAEQVELQYRTATEKVQRENRSLQKQLEESLSNSNGKRMEGKEIGPAHDKFRKEQR